MIQTTPSIGKIRGYSCTANQAGVFSILAFDHRQSFIKMLNPGQAGGQDYPAIVAAKTQFVRLLAPHASAVLLDPVYGAAQSVALGALPNTSGLIVALEETGYTGSDTARESAILQGWSVQKTKCMGADAIKLLVYYHPEAGSITARQEALIQQVIAECHSDDILLFLEIVTYSPYPGQEKSSPEFARSLPDLLPTIAGRLGALGPDVLKLEFPISVRLESDETRWLNACQAVSQASPCPWALLSAAANFETFTRQVEIACTAGASGFIAGRAVWQEAVSMPEDQRERWLAEVGASRLQALNAIASHYARPWRDLFPNLAASVSEDWYLRYAE